jgi:hypothetical protein
MFGSCYWATDHSRGIERDMHHARGMYAKTICHKTGPSIATALFNTITKLWTLQNHAGR